MKLYTEFTQADINAVKNVIKAYPAEWRYQRNVAGPVTEIDDEQLWLAHIHCLLSTQQKSGEGSPINAFLKQTPFPLSLQSCRTNTNLHDSTLDLLTNAKGIRRTNKIAKALYNNLARLENGEWDKLHEWRDKLMVQRQNQPDPTHHKLEEDAAAYMDNFQEFGPKQSRNFWQLLGLTRYVFVLDSRVIGWLRNNLELESGLLTSAGLIDPLYYQFVSNMLFRLCTQADVLPCMFDGAVFESYEKPQD